VPKVVRCRKCTSSNVRPLFGKLLLVEGLETFRSVGYICFDCGDIYVDRSKYTRRVERVTRNKWRGYMR